MSSFFINYRDPIFSIIVLVSIIFIISFINYIITFIGKKDEINNIEKFMKDFQNSNLEIQELDFLKKIDLNTEYLFILANIFIKNGDFEKAINIYHIALKKAQSKSEKELILTNLGKIYFKAGFLQKCNEILFKALKLNPRNEEALRFLMVSYEKLKLFDDELDVLDALKELGANVTNEENYVKSLKILNNKKINFKEKIYRLKQCYYKDTPRIILESFILQNENLNDLDEFPPLRSCIDIIWNLNSPINLKDDDYNALFYAKNLSDKKTTSEIFELNALNAMKDANFTQGNIKFSYICSKCKSKIPMFFYRCPICYRLGDIVINIEISKKKDEINYTI